MVVHDLTVAYRDHIPEKRTTEFDFVFGTFPSEVHIFVKRLECTDIPEDPDEEKEVRIDFEYFASE